MITPDQLTEWERLAAAATPGEWFHNSYGTIHSTPLVRKLAEMEQAIPEDAPDDDPRYAALPDTEICGHSCWDYHAHPDAAFIAAARTAVPALVEEVRRLRAILDRVTTDLEGFADFYQRIAMGPDVHPMMKSGNEVEFINGIDKDIAEARAALSALVAEVRGTREVHEEARRNWGLALDRARLATARAEAAEAEVRALRDDYAAVAHAAGIEHVQDMGPSYPGPVDAVVRAIVDGRRAEGEVADARFRAEAAEAEVVRLREALLPYVSGETHSGARLVEMDDAARAALEGSSNRAPEPK